MEGGKPAGVPCVHLTEEFLCGLFGKPERPAFCSGLAPSPQMCGNSREDALAHLDFLEAATRP